MRKMRSEAGLNTNPRGDSLTAAGNEFCGPSDALVRQWKLRSSRSGLMSSCTGSLSSIVSPAPV